MSHLIAMRQRIRAIETIKKITHAMRLISMSLHGRYKHNEDALSHYKHGIQGLFQKIKAQTSSWQHAVLYPPATLPSKILIMLVGSQKGLCGNFNSALFKFFEMHKPGLLNVRYITIGKKTTDYAKSHGIGPVEKTYVMTPHATPSSLAQELSNIILDPSHQYTQVIMFSTVPRTFFLQRPIMTQLIPFVAPTAAHHKEQEYIWEQDPQLMLDFLAQQYLEITIQHLLVQSLLAEQAARFVSMDTATRNAKNILEETRLAYNKLRQANITKEITELTSSF